MFPSIAAANSSNLRNLATSCDGILCARSHCFHAGWELSFTLPCSFDDVGDWGKLKQFPFSDPDRPSSLSSMVRHLSRSSAATAPSHYLEDVGSAAQKMAYRSQKKQRCSGSLNWHFIWTSWRKSMCWAGAVWSELEI